MSWLVRAFHRPSTREFRVLHSLVAGLIAISVLIFVTEIWRGREGLAPWLVTLDRVILWAFTVELIARVASFRPPRLDLESPTPASTIRHHLLGRLTFLLRPSILIDLLTVSALLPALRGLRALRLLRLARTPFRYASPMRSISQAFRDNALLYLLALSFVLTAVLIGGLSFYLVESDINAGLTGPADGVWWALVTLTTVGFGDITPVTTLGRMIGAALMISGMLSLALFAGVVGQSLVQSVLTIRKEQFRMSGHINHIVVCGYELGMEMLLEAIRQEVDADESALVLFAPGERPNDLPPEVVWVNGDPTKESELEKARVAYARAAILIGSRSDMPQAADAQTILTAFTIRSWMSRNSIAAKRRDPLYVVAEILDEENIDHAYSAGVDEVIETTHLGFSMLSHAVVMPGTASILSTVASAGGQSLFVGQPGQYQGQSFVQAAGETQRQSRWLALGVRDHQGQDTLNPDPDRLIGEKDCLIYLAKAR